MRLLTRQEIHKEFRIPLGSIDGRMEELGVPPYLPARHGRGYHLLYDADEIAVALREDREQRQNKRLQPLSRRSRKQDSDNIYKMGWSKAKTILNIDTPRQ